MLNTFNLHNIFWPFLIVWMYLLSASSQKYLLALWTRTGCCKWKFFIKMQLLNLQKPMFFFCKWESCLWQEKLALNSRVKSLNEQSSLKEVKQSKRIIFALLNLWLKVCVSKCLFLWLLNVRCKTLWKRTEGEILLLTLPCHGLNKKPHPKPQKSYICKRWHHCVLP